MFFRRMFNRRDNQNTAEEEMVDDEEEAAGSVDFRKSPRRRKRNYSSSDKNNNSRRSGSNENRMQGPSTAPSCVGGRASISGALPVVQLTPLWEHILRTRTLPDNICPYSMFNEFLERLKDPEWQVRQHALRVLVDVLVIMQARADIYMEPLIPQLVENLGHPAPTVRKGALDCLRVYLAETDMPETILLQILDIGLNQKITNEPFGGRLTCGVLLSVPALVQSILHTPKRHFILRTTVDMLIQKMGQVTNQEITLKVLTKLKELIGDSEFTELMSHGAYREYELLCNVYGVESCSASAQSKNSQAPMWIANQNVQTVHSLHKTKSKDYCWHLNNGEKHSICPPKEAKIIMETEIKINDDTLTMRILEAKDEECNDAPNKLMECEHVSNTTPNSLEDEIVCGRLESAKSLQQNNTKSIQLLSDSDKEEPQQRIQYTTTVVTPSTPSRTPKRVTFGGEVVKMRTPDSDASNNNNNGNKPPEIVKNLNINQHSENFQVLSDNLSPPAITAIEPVKMTALSVEIPNDNTKPLAKQTPTSNSPKKDSLTASPANSNKGISPSKSHSSPSPKSPFKRINISPVDSIISPKAPHKEIEVLHNLQRDPSPVMRPMSLRRLEQETEVHSSMQQSQQNTPQAPPPKNWEELGIVDYNTLMKLRSGVSGKINKI